MYSLRDIVIGKVHVQSNKKKGVVQIMVFQSWDPFVVVRVIGGHYYYVRRYGKPNGTLKFVTEDFYLLPP